MLILRVPTKQANLASNSASVTLYGFEVFTQKSLFQNHCRKLTKNWHLSGYLVMGKVFLDFLDHSRPLAHLLQGGGHKKNPLLKRSSCSRSNQQHNFLLKHWPANEGFVNVALADTHQRLTLEVIWCNYWQSPAPVVLCMVLSRPSRRFEKNASGLGKKKQKTAYLHLSNPSGESSSHFPVFSLHLTPMCRQLEEGREDKLYFPSPRGAPP